MLFGFDLSKKMLFGFEFMMKTNHKTSELIGKRSH